jgi:hypothetical protein
VSDEPGSSATSVTAPFTSTPAVSTKIVNTLLANSRALPVAAER